MVKNVPGTGQPKTISLGDPAVGNDYGVQTVPAGKQWIVVGFEGELITSAVAVTRFFTMGLDDGTNQYEAGIAGAGQAASLTRDYHGGTNLPAVAVDIHISVTIPKNLLLAGDRVTFNTANIDAGDNWGPGFLRVYELIE